MCISDYMQTTFFYLGRFLKKLADDQCSSITKGSIYYIKHMQKGFKRNCTDGTSSFDVEIKMNENQNFICTYNILAWEWIDLKLDV